MSSSLPALDDSVVGAYECVSSCYIMALFAMSEDAVCLLFCCAAAVQTDGARYAD